MVLKRDIFDKFNSVAALLPDMCVLKIL